MPAKNTIAKYHGRHVFITKKLWKKYVKESKSKVSYEEFKKIISESIEETKKWILREPVGFMLPKRLGNITVNKFRTYGKFRVYTKDSNGEPMKGHNLHTGGCTFRLQWFKNTRSFRERSSFWFFTAERGFKRALAKILKSGNSPLYNTYMQDQFTIK